MKRSARRTLIAIAIVAGLASAVTSLLGVFKMLAEMREQAASQQIEVLASAIQASLHNDLLSSNMLLASDRLKSMLSAKQWHSFCVKVSPVPTPSENPIQIGPDEICSNPLLPSSSRTISFDELGEKPAFQILVKSDPARLDFSPSTKFEIALTVCLIIPFVALLFLSGFANRLLSSVFSILQTGKTSSPVFLENEFQELLAIKQLLIERNENILEAEKAVSAVREAESRGLLAKQVSHDIRSPLAALNLAIGSVSGLPDENKQLIRNAVRRINDIATNLLSQADTALKEPSRASAPAPNKAQMLAILIDSIVAEKRVQYSERSNVTIRAEYWDSFKAFAEVDPSEFSRALSNLLNNAIEALGEKPGFVRVALYAGRSEHKILIQDNGIGMSPEVLAQVGKKGFSYGKSGSGSGAGIGLYQAKETTERSHGKLIIESEENRGTQITIVLPATRTPSWFVPEIILHEGHTLVVVDDEELMHLNWRKLVKNAAGTLEKIQLIVFSNPTDFRNWHATSARNTDLYFIDFDFGPGIETGLDLITSLSIQSQATLVSSRVIEHEVRSQAELEGVRLIPKLVLEKVPIRLEG